MPAPSTKLRPATYEDLLRLPENVVGEIVNGDLVVGSFGGNTQARIPPFDAVAIDVGALWDLGPPQS